MEEAENGTSFSGLQPNPLISSRSNDLWCDANMLLFRARERAPETLFVGEAAADAKKSTYITGSAIKKAGASEFGELFGRRAVKWLSRFHSRRVF